MGKDINTDVIIPGKYLVFTDPVELAKHAMEGVDPAFPQKAAPGVILVAEDNFGCGSSREQAPMALKHSGVRCVVADTIARIFYRNSINIGLPVLECEGVSKTVSEGDEVDVDLTQGLVINQTKNRKLKTQPLPNFILDIINSGGLIAKLRSQVISR